MRLSNCPRLKNRLSLTPLIDVVFLLLIFFILASTFMQFSAVPVSTVSATGVAPPTQKEIALIRVPAGVDGMTINGRRLMLDNLESTIEEFIVNGVSHAIVQPIAEANVQNLVSVLEVLKKTELDSVVVAKSSE